MRYDERPAWRALLSWPDDCEEGFQRFEYEPGDAGGIAVYPVAEGQYLAFVTCNLGPYWEEQRVYWLDYRASPPVVHSIAIPELVQDDAPELGLHEVDVLHGAFPNYYPDTQTLTNLHAYRGLKDCGVFYRYHIEIEEARLVLDEARYRDCDDMVTSPLLYDEWPLIYPLTSSGPFRKIVSVPADLQGQITRLEALPGGDLRLVTTAGYALWHDGVWRSYFLAPSQRFIGVDAAGRLWFFPEESPETIFYWDSAIADQGGSAFVQADDGWLPPAEPAALQSQGVLTDGQGQVWLATEEDVRVFAGGRWTIFTRETLGMPSALEEDAARRFTLTYVENRQQMWVGECDLTEGPVGGGGARWLDTAAFAAGDAAWRGAQSPVAGGCVTAIAADAEGRVWIGLEHGVVQRFDQTSGDWQQFTPPAPGNHRSPAYPLALLLDPTGEPWVLFDLCGPAGCQAGRAFYHLQAGVWIEVFGPGGDAEDLPLTDASLRILLDGAGAPWVFLGGSAFRIENNRLVRPAVAGLNVIEATVDATGQLWLVGQAGDEAPAIWAPDPGGR